MCIRDRPKAAQTVALHTATGCAAGLILPARPPPFPTLLSPRAVNSLKVGSFVGIFTSLVHGIQYLRDGEADVLNYAASGLLTGSGFGTAATRSGISAMRYGGIGAALGTVAGVVTISSQSMVNTLKQADSNVAPAAAPAVVEVPEEREPNMPNTTSKLDETIQALERPVSYTHLTLPTKRIV
eukprot:TRINITY_DN8712_c0_g1_i2.p1 TRINITY_DN8712_c0_g1~~TRINITY_DN8712_c0_g1_i2.p1  ORF type:complete len:183 (-),score=32.27 TRINITY_DN8712_c0_g1_i2:102-650(-)